MNNKKIAVFPGSFDPITIGHVDIAERAMLLFDEIIIAIGSNSTKRALFPLEERKQWIVDCFENKAKITVQTYSGLTVDFCKKVQANYLIRGIRSTADFEYEQPIAQMNKAMEDKLETIFFMAKPEFTAISSSIVRDIIRNGGDISKFIPPQVNPGKV